MTPSWTANPPRKSSPPAMPQTRGGRRLRRSPAPKGRAQAAPKAPPAPKAPRKSTRQTPMEALTKSVLRTAGSTLTRELLRGILGGLRR